MTGAGRILIVGTNNNGKMREIREILKDCPVEIKSLNDAGIDLSVEEDGDTFEENALKKARAACAISGEWALADDSGIEVEELNGAPGIHSARFAGSDCDSEKNNDKLLAALVGVPEERRTARFRCVMAFVSPEGTEHVSSGILEGRIALEKHPGIGFGYDPVFVVPEYERTVSELGYEIKNRVSHRAEALRKFHDWFKTFIETR